MTAIHILLGVLAIMAVVLLAAFLLVPVVVESTERIRIQRATHDASWQIHRQAAQAFGEMLDAAREAESREDQL